MDTLVSILVPTCFRLERLKAAYERLRVTTQDLNTEVIFVVDEDVQTWNWLVDNHASNQRQLFRDTLQGPNSAWNAALSVSKGDIIFISGDDSYAEDGWLHTALEAHAKLGNYGWVGINDKIHHGHTLMTTPLYDRQFCKDHLGGVAFCPHYVQLFADSENHRRAVRSGHWTWCEDAVVRHLWNEVPKTDYSRIREMKNWDHDEKLFLDRQLRGFPDDFPSVI